MENDKIILIRKTLKLSQKDFGEKIGLKTTSVCDIEHHRCNVSNRTKLLLYSNLRINPDWFENDNGPMFIDFNPTKEEFFEIFEKLSPPLQDFLLKTAKHLIEIQNDF